MVLRPLFDRLYEPLMMNAMQQAAVSRSVNSLSCSGHGVMNKNIGRHWSRDGIMKCNTSEMEAILEPDSLRIQGFLGDITLPILFP